MDMKSTLLVLSAIAFPMLSIGQNFAERISLNLSDSLVFDDVEVADIDNDSLLDIILFARGSAGQTSIFMLANKGANSMEFAGQFRTNMIEESHHLTDIDGDNQVDVIISGEREGEPLTTIFLNRGNFDFGGTLLAGLKGTLVRLADLDGDGSREFLLSGNSEGVPFVRILRNTSSRWKVVHDSIAVHASALEVFDFDADNKTDFFVSGIDEKGDPVSHVFINQGGFYFSREAIGPPLAGITSRGDLNHDGLFDIMLWGKDAAGNNVLRTLLNGGSGFYVEDSLMTANASEVIIADFDSDGRADLHFFGVHSNGDTLNIISRNYISDTIAHSYVHRQTVGDFDRDGNLDMVQLRRRAGVSSVALLENMNPVKNLPPAAPEKANSARIFNRIFLSWNIASDDHTPVASLTYDLSIHVADKNLVPGEFDLLHERRLLVSHGNNTTQRYALVRDAEAGPFYFLIQSVDNSYHAGKGGVCKGAGGGGSGGIACADDTETVYMDACSDELLTLNTEFSAEWFSFSEGFLGETRSLSFSLQYTDTLFSVESTEDACARIKVYVIQVSQVVKKVTDSTVYVCEGETIHLGVESHWMNTQWSSSIRGPLSEGDSIDYIFSIPDTVTVAMSNGTGCEIERRTILKLSKPQIDVTPEAYQILKGQSVRLNAAGGSVYEWTPLAGLDDPTSSSPVASPLRTTEYVVTVKDSLGCQVTGSITVIVEETAFIPNLFTPNNDGSNDVLKIYGLGAAREFSFTVFNREGNQVFHTKSISDAMNIGWNGTFRGADVPAGVYYWNVTGLTDSGKGLQLNGKNSGSIVLLR